MDSLIANHPEIKFRNFSGFVNCPEDITKMRNMSIKYPNEIFYILPWCRQWNNIRKSINTNANLKYLLINNDMLHTEEGYFKNPEVNMSGPTGSTEKRIDTVYYYPSLREGIYPNLKNDF